MPLMPSKFSNPWPYNIVAQKLHPINAPDYDTYIQAIAGLPAGDTALTVFLTDPPDAPMAAAYDAMLKHVRKHWCADGEDSFWPDIENKANLLKRGWLQLLQTLKRDPKPVSIFWLCDHQAEEKRAIQVGVCEQTESVVMIILTPFVNYGDLPALETVSEHIWVVSDEAGADAIVEESASQGLSAPKKNTPQCADAGDGVWVTEVHTVPPI